MPARGGEELEQGAAAVRVGEREVLPLVVPVHLEQSLLHAVVEPRAAKDELLEPVDERLAVSERGWKLALSRDEVLSSLRNALGAGAFPFCIQDARQAPPPGSLSKEPGIRSYYLLELTGLARGVLLVAHTDAAPRGFTLLCRQLGARVAEVASTVLGFGLIREWTASESARLQSEFAALEGGAEP